MGIIEGATIIDFSNPAFKKTLANMDKEVTYLVYCASGGRSKSTQQMMNQMGFKSVYDLNRNNLLGKIAFSKMIVVFLVVITVISTEAYQKEHTIGFIPIAINTLIGVFISVASISLYNMKQGYVNFKYLLWGVLVMLPSFFIFLLKINPIQWFDKSDLSHAIIIAGNCFFYLGLQKLNYRERPFLS